MVIAATTMAGPQAGRFLKSLPWRCRRCQFYTEKPRLAAPSIQHLKGFSTSKPSTADIDFKQINIQAAPEVDFDQQSSQAGKPARIVPASPSYFTASPQLNDNVLLLRSLVQRFQSLPTVSPEQAPRIAWLKLSQYRTKVGEPVTASKYAKILLLLGRLNRIHPQLRTREIKEVIEQFKRPGSAELQIPKVQKLDQYGRAKGIGRRKESSARVYLVEGTGEVLINGKSIVQAFPRLHDRESALWALKATQRVDKYNVWALVEGGGVTGQAESITLALARALLVHEPALKPALRRGELELYRTLRTANEMCSRNGHIRRKACGEEEAWPPKGEKEASLGQTVIGHFLLSQGLLPVLELPLHNRTNLRRFFRGSAACRSPSTSNINSHLRLKFPILCNKPAGPRLFLLLFVILFLLHVSRSTGFASRGLPRRQIRAPIASFAGLYGVCPPSFAAVCQPCPVLFTCSELSVSLMPSRAIHQSSIGYQVHYNPVFAFL
jgi:small subunit ribosomal protein S9